MKGKAQAEREMDALVKEKWGLLPEDESPVKTEMQELRQRIEDALTKARATNALEVGEMARCVQAGGIAMLKVILDQIDEIAEGK